MIWSLLRYYWYKFNDPKYLDFVDQGLGVENRARKYHKHWTPHLNKSKSFLIKCLEVLKADYKGERKPRILVIGAGRLNDFPTSFFMAAGVSVCFLDLDPCNVPLWKKWERKYPGQVSWILSDITSKLEAWTEHLRRFSEQANGQLPSAKLSDLMEDLFSIGVVQEQQDFDLVISLNLISQLGIFWKDRISTILRLSGSEGAEDQALKTFIDKTSAKLEQEHLIKLSQISRSMVCIIGDEHFYYYSKNISPWQTEKATISERPFLLNGFSRILEDCWLWHIRPQATEGMDYGEIHRVVGECFIREKQD